MSYRPITITDYCPVGTGDQHDYADRNDLGSYMRFRIEALRQLNHTRDLLDDWHNNPGDPKLDGMCHTTAIDCLMYWYDRSTMNLDFEYNQDCDDMRRTLAAANHGQCRCWAGDRPSRYCGPSKKNEEEDLLPTLQDLSVTPS